MLLLQLLYIDVTFFDNTKQFTLMMFQGLPQVVGPLVFFLVVGVALSDLVMKWNQIYWHMRGKRLISQ